MNLIYMTNMNSIYITQYNDTPNDSFPHRFKFSKVSIVLSPFVR